jgi:hypothetical protein
MFWSGFAVLLIVPAAFIMICGCVFLESRGVLPRLRRLWHSVCVRGHSKKAA